MNPTTVDHGRDARAASFFLLMEDYEDAYSQLAESLPGLSELTFEQCAHELFEAGIFYGDAWVNALQAIGCPVRQTVPICLPLQYKWAKENGVLLPPAFASRAPFRWYWQYRYHTTPTRRALWRIVEEQLQCWQPEFTWMFSGIPISHAQLQRCRRHTHRLLLWWTATRETGFPYDGFDLILSADSRRVAEFRAQGLTAIHLAHAFDPRMLHSCPPMRTAARQPTVAFVGTLQPVHRERARVLGILAEAVPLAFFGPGIATLPVANPLQTCVRGPVWGKDLYQVYGSHLLAFHKQGDFLQSTAGSKRIFEATGMGACLVTEWTEDLKNFFEPDREVVTYRSLEECIEKVKYLLAHPAEAAAIGQRGQARTLRDHTYRQRTEQLLEILREHRFLD